MYAADRFQRVHDFIDFCKSKPPEKRYNWEHAGVCACGQFFGNSEWGWKEQKIHDDTGISFNQIAFYKPRTFGALAKRVEKELLHEKQIIS